MSTSDEILRKVYGELFPDELDKFVCDLHKTASESLQKMRARAVRSVLRDPETHHVDLEIMFRQDVNGYFDQLEIVLSQLTLVNLVARLRWQLTLLLKIGCEQHLSAISNAQGNESAPEIRGLIRAFWKSFGIRLQDAPVPLAYFHEMIVARNDVIHNNGQVSTHYLTIFPTPRFVDESGVHVALPQDELANGIANVKALIQWVSSKLPSQAS